MPFSQKHLKQLRKLGQKKFRATEGTFIVEGLRLTGEAIDSDYAMLEALHTGELLETPAGRSLVERLRKKTTRVEEVTPRELSRLTDTVTAQGVVAVLRQKDIPVESLVGSSKGASILVGFDAVSDPGNLGSMIRTCDWFGASGILVGKNSCELFSPKVVRSSMGSLFHLPVARNVDLLLAISAARASGYTVYVTDANGETHFDRVRFDTRTLIIFGNEAWGVSDQIKELSDIRLAIRRYGAAESLNVGVACGVVLSALHRLYDE